MTIIPLAPSHWPKVVSLADAVLGLNYITLEDLNNNFSKKNETNAQCSFVLTSLDRSKLFGFRLTFAPNFWPQSLIDKSLTPSQDLSQVAYFKTIVVDPALQGQGWGPKLTSASTQSLKKMGANAIICHSWKESPNNSSTKYLQKMGFSPVGEVKNFWQDKDYDCVLCHPLKCFCTAIEMIKMI